MKKHIIKIVSIAIVPVLFWGGTFVGKKEVVFDHTKPSWADSVLQTLTLEEKIAQLISIRAHSNKNQSYNQEIVKQVEKYQVGGVCFFQGGPARQAILTNRMQEVSKIPLMVSIDGEWGLAMRLDSVNLYPRQMALGASRDLNGIYRMGNIIAEQCKRTGVHVNFAPCVDVNTSPDNPVIGSRSFGSSPQWVARCGIAYGKGMQDHGVMACAKHFPGHGDTKDDSHYALPVITHDTEHLQQIELYPFRELIQSGVDAIMISHLNIPSLDSAETSIATASYQITTELLQNKMKFNGLIFTDGLEMKGIANYYQTGDLEVQVLKAGCDVLLLPGNLDIVIPAILEAIKQGVLSESEIDKKCLKVLKMKEKYVLPQAKPVSVENIVDDLNSPQAAAIYKQLTEHSITVLQNKNHILPFKEEQTKKIVHLRADKGNSNVLQKTLADYMDIVSYREKNDFKENTASAFAKVKDADYVIVSLHNTSQYARNNYALQPKTIWFLDSLTKEKEVILVIMNNPYCLEFIPFSERFAAIVLAYHSVDLAEEAVGKVLCGAIPAQGKLPIALTRYAVGTGVEWKATKDLQEEETNVYLKKIDEIAQNGIRQKAYPGCRVLLYHKDKIVYNKAFGTFGYTDATPVLQNTVYDIASITKIAATTLAVMKLYDEGKIEVKNKLSDYLPYLKNTNKQSITVAEIMTHTAGLQAWIPFYTQTLLPNNTLNPTVFNNHLSDEFPVQVCENLYIKKNYKDTIVRQIIESKLRPNKHYLYSDLGFYLLADLVKTVSGKTLDKYVEEAFYARMGLSHILFNPLTQFELKDIPPSENDVAFRKQLIQGFVHDQGAAMLGGVSGHAGLFASADDLLAVLKMLLHKGVYNGERYLSKKTIDYFTSYYYHQGNCRRGLGFDKPARDNSPSPCSKFASEQSYGHSGFTGTFVWVDPKYDLVYIFLSNRIHPLAENRKITQLNIRTEIQDMFYQYIKEK
ncbi:MAG: serine hydrolase [Bacteroidales bacterium]|jgi:beta-glucosidase-like glycosyl hydrolase/CubicO group peptidase (beta-lactamase class C family)|nr:serine hydrolase [Bacteroidales bacterium]